MNPQVILYLVLIVVLLVFSAFFSSCDMAYSVVNKKIESGDGQRVLRS